MKNVKEKDVLINRSQMVQIAREYNIFVSQGTIHRWANEPGFPMAIGKKGKFLLYSKKEFVEYVLKRVRKMQLTY
ncbi:hypothetical protein H8D57_01315 [bacterium]|nr:hypothetical protein [bacterium]